MLKKYNQAKSANNANSGSAIQSNYQTKSSMNKTQVGSKARETNPNSVLGASAAN